MLELKELSFSYDDRPVLNNLHLEVAPGSIHGILGTNGAGKTTLFKCMYGLLSPTAGSVRWNGEVLGFRRIAFLETSNFFYSNITGREYLQLTTATPGQFPISDWNQIFQLPLDRLIEGYSTGMKKQLAFLGILAQDRPILILDEPFNGLDLESSEKLSLIIQRLSDRNKTILIASHILETLTRNCDRISHLAEGKIARTFEASEFPKMTETLRAKLQQDIADDLDRVLE